MGKNINYGQPVNWAHPLNRGLLAWWLVLPQWRGGKRFRDLCNRYHGTLTDMDPSTDWVSSRGRPGGFGALQTDNSMQFVDVGDVDVLEFTDEIFTWSAWFNQVAGDDGYLMSKNEGSSGWGWYFNNGSITVYLNGSADLTVSSVYTTAVWNHAIATCDGTTITMYINGKSVGSGPRDFDLQTNTGALHIGAALLALPFNGLIDGVRLSNRHYTASYAASLYLEELQGYPNLLNRFSMPYYVKAAAPQILRKYPSILLSMS